MIGNSEPHSIFKCVSLSMIFMQTAHDKHGDAAGQLVESGAHCPDGQEHERVGVQGHRVDSARNHGQRGPGERERLHLALQRRPV